MTSTSPWFRLPLNAILPEQPTYFTGSVLGPSAERALQTAYEEFGAPLGTGTAVWDSRARRAALNDTLLQPADESLRRSLGDSGGGLSRLLGGGAGKRTATLITQTLADAPEMVARIERWWTRVRAMEWRQATVLQIMEELEPRAEDALLAQQRVALSLAAALQLQASQIKSVAAETVTGLNAGIDASLPAAGYTAALDSLATSLKGVDTSGAGEDWRQWPAVLREPMDTFLTGYGRWADQPLETARPRWVDDPSALLAVLPGSTAGHDSAKAGNRRATAADSISRQLSGGKRKQFDAATAQVEQLVALLPRVHEAVVIVAAAARYWVSGAANEALADGRLETADEVFLLELEELKQMMTGEWSNVEQVRPIIEARIHSPSQR
ncbi:MAG: hypothetical protein KDI55_07550 [Anaerolineae bacterium]|nr:hypothetical protein [Anaerolineae bacterium]